MPPSRRCRGCASGSRKCRRRRRTIVAVRPTRRPGLSANSGLKDATRGGALVEQRVERFEDSCLVLLGRGLHHVISFPAVLVLPSAGEPTILQLSHTTAAETSRPTVFWRDGDWPCEPSLA